MVKQKGKTRVQRIGELNTNYADWKVKQNEEYLDMLGKHTDYLISMYRFAFGVGAAGGFIAFLSFLLLVFRFKSALVGDLPDLLVYLLIIIIALTITVFASKVTRKMQRGRIDKQAIIDTYMFYVEKYKLQEQFVDISNRYPAEQFEVV